MLQFLKKECFTYRRKKVQTEQEKLFTKEKTDTGTEVPAIVNSDLCKKAFRKNWARLIQKVYNVDPLKCQYCNGKMIIISFVEDEETIKKILNLWEVQNHDPPDDFKVPQQFKDFISTNSVLSGNKEKNNETCDEMPKYEDWF